MNLASQSPAQFIGSSPVMQDIYRAITNLLGNDLTVTITGESGSGKALLAQMLHESGKRKSGAFIELNLAAIPPELQEDYLFSLNGKCGQAAGGTLFLADIDMLSREVQTRLLQLLQQGEFFIGETMLKADFRLICSTTANLMQMLGRGQFNEELYYRLNVIPLRIPPLRARKEDIAPLAQFFLQRAVENGLPARILEAETIAAMQEYDWPGNVREMENMMLRFCTLTNESMISREMFLKEKMMQNHYTPVQSEATLEQNVMAHLQNYFAAHDDGQLPPSGLYERILPLIEKPLIEMTLRATGGNQVKAAYVLGINRNTLRKKMAELKIQSGSGL